MALQSADEPVNTPPALPASLSAAIGDGLSKLGAPAPEPVPEPVASAPAPEPAAPVQTPLDAVDTPVDEDEGVKLPFETEEPEPAEPEPADPEHKAGRRIEELKKELKTVWKPKVTELEQTVAQRDARIAELEGIAAEAEQLRALKAEYEAEMSVTKLEKTDEFKTQISEPLNRIEKEAVRIAKENDIDINKLFNAIQGATEADREAALEEAISGLDIRRGDEFKIRELIKEAQPIFDKREELYANADKALAELVARKESQTAAETAAQAAARAEERSKMTDLVVTKLNKSLPFLKEITDSLADGTRSTDFAALDTANQAYSHLAGQALPKVAALYKAVMKERDQLLDDLSAYRSSTPRPVGDPAPSEPKELPKSLAAAVSDGLARR